MELSQAYDTLWADLGGGFSLLLLVLIGMVLVVWDAFKNEAPALPWVGAATLGVALVWEVFHLSSESTTAFYDLIRVGGFASFINIVVLGSGLFSIVLSVPYLKQIKHG